MLIDGLVGIAIIAIIWFVVEDYPQGMAQHHQQQLASLKQFGFWKSLRDSYLNRHNWACGIYTSLMNLPIFILGGILIAMGIALRIIKKNKSKKTTKKSKKK